MPVFDGGLGAGWVAGLGVRESLLVGIGSDVDSVALIQRQQAVWEARSVVWLAAAAAKADRLAGLPGGSMVHARRSLVAEVATTLVVSEGVAARRVDDAQFLVEFLPATLAALAGGEIGYRCAEVMVRQAVSLPENARAGFEVVALAGVAGLTPSQFVVGAAVAGAVASGVDRCASSGGGGGAGGLGGAGAGWHGDVGVSPAGGECVRDR
ncbi:13E12 repeat family protein [Herbiconiux daphne]|uniref:13E12 repeat family protein n=1 Tax=Herbiconiux daphne TaxID=2970914 RepID=A0ABT2H5B4_9MICO|nr:13E12 repeat family protein [Herbiconiux daphne]MCS5735145.1 13E12 repeat family protein [Herbiconiux daphne]